MDNRKLTGYNTDIYQQLKILEAIINSSPMLNEVLERADTLKLDNYYLGAGSITQTVWNYLYGYDLEYGIKDIDFVYYDNNNMDYDSEDKVIKRVKNLYSDIEKDIDVKNQARVHLWYKDHFGKKIAPYVSLETAINTWPTTATAIGVRRSRETGIKIYAPYGLNDLFGKIVRPNKVQITEEIYMKKVTAWLEKWPGLTIIPW